MPDTNGLEFLKKVKTLNNSIKCYIHSGINITDEIREALSKKLIDDFFEKPLNISYIYDSITSFKKINLP
jgi:DNA-binding NtrC family response regulator